MPKSMSWLLILLAFLTVAIPLGAVLAKDKDTKPEDSKPAGQLFENVIKDFRNIEGLFTFYVKPEDGKVLMAIKPEQLGKIYLCNITRSAGDGTYYDNGADNGNFPFEFKRIGQNIQMVEINLRFRADSTAPLSRAIERGVSNSIFGAVKLEGLPQKETGVILVNPAGFFIQDVSNLNYFLGKTRQLEYSFDKDNSYFGTIKSFPQNSEIDAIYHFKTNKPNDAQTFPSPYSMLHTYHFSLSTLQTTDYVPRLADERVGYFQTIYQDYSKLDTETPYIRYINRWNLQKAYPDSVVSPPKEPIVFWLENTIPDEYRPFVAKGILLWNKAFEKIGIRDAIVVKQMSDTANWDPADIRYNTIRWVIYPGQAYAVGPSRTNPFTGQIYDADIRVCVDFIRYMYSFSEYFIDPINSKANNFGPNLQMPDNDRACTFDAESAQNAAFDYGLLLARDEFSEKSAMTKQYVEEYITDLVNHEVGHTLGLRHNFKASSIHSNADRNNPDLIGKEGLSGSVMDYNPSNIALKGAKQGEFYHLGPGPYDYWAIEYGYKSFGAKKPDDEKAALDQIASRCANPLYAYGTDEDAFGNSSKGIDPLCSQFDLSSDPIGYFKDEIALSKELWGKIEQKFGQPGYRYQKMMSAFTRGFRSYRLAIEIVPKYIGGIYRNNDHVGDPNGRIPFQPATAAKQKEAMAFLRDYIFAPDAFNFPASLLNKLQPERLDDFGESADKTNRVDYPIHDVILSIQKAPIDRLYDPITLSRLQDIELRYDKGQEKYTMANMFADLRQSIWTELSPIQNINSYRRPLQRYHLDKLISLLLDKQPGIPDDSRDLARNDLGILQRYITRSLTSTTLDVYTKSHLEESKARIDSALKASVQRNLGKG